ncbi:hypothetical protein C8Q80DRAFT_1101924 [Daedaleopsis nitida]|nr:hypothetical protein C8Q80DRAFT_1101924 [Daedaleopsis nitida]
MDVRLPSIKDLNFPPPGQDGAPTNGSGRPEHPRARHDPTSWGRPPHASSPAHPQSQHSSTMPPPHEQPKSHQYAAPPKQDASPYAHPQHPPPTQQQQPGPPPHNAHNPMAPGAQRPENPSEPSSKRSRSSQSGVSASPARSPHVSLRSPVKGTPYPPYPQVPQSAYHQPPPQQTAPPPPPEHAQQPPSHYPHAPPSQPPPGYAPYPPPPVPQRQHYANMPPPPAPPPHHQPQPHPPVSYPPPQQPVEHWQHPPAQQPPPPAPQQQQYNGYARPTPLVPANVETRPPSVPTPADAERASRRQHVITEIVRHCSVLYGFAHHYAQLANTHPHLTPAPPEIAEMNSHASEVVHLLEELRRLELGEDVSRKEAYPATANPTDEHARPPKRPWEDMAHEGEPAPANGYDNPTHSPYFDEQAQSTAEADMQIIRNKRQSSTGGAAPGQQKNKYRKRSRATPPGKCHSCNIRETPEWRRGPDGARTLCNACGLHYAKLMRKRDKTLDNGLKAPPIDLQMLRASTASARGSGGNEQGSEPPHTPHPSGHPPAHQAQPPPSPYDQPKQAPVHAAPPPPQHPGQYQLMPVVNGAPSGAPPHQMMPPPHAPGSAPQSAAGAPVPPPPWLTSSAGAERGGYNPEPQSYVRASHPPSHARASPQ